jgi:hypothetical protein
MRLAEGRRGQPSTFGMVAGHVAQEQRPDER